MVHTVPPGSSAGILAVTCTVLLRLVEAGLGFAACLARPGAGNGPCSCVVLMVLGGGVDRQAVAEVWSTPVLDPATRLGIAGVDPPCEPTSRSRS